MSRGLAAGHEVMTRGFGAGDEVLTVVLPT